jgi:hypothetical protein
MNVHKTIGGTSFDWFGGDNPVISLSGSLWSYWIDMLPAPFGNGILPDGVPTEINNLTSNIINSVGNASAKMLSGFYPLNQMSGLEEFFRIKYMLYDFFSPSQGKNAPRSLNSLGKPLTGLSFLEERATNNKNNLEDVQLIYHDYDDDVHWEVIPSGPLKIQRDKRDAFTVGWQIQLTGIRDIRSQAFRVPAQSKKFAPDETMEEIATLLISNPVNAGLDVYYGALDTVQSLYAIDGFPDVYSKTIDKYFLKKETNQSELVYQSQIYVNTANEASVELIENILVPGIEINAYIAESLTNMPSQSVVDSGKDKRMSDIAKSIILAETLAGIDAYTGRRIPIMDGKTSNTLQDLPAIDESLFNSASGIGKNEVAQQAGKVQYSENKWVTYVVKRSDNLGKIAVQQLGDYSRFPEIARLNGLVMDDFLLDNMVGETIKLPDQKQTNYNNPNNLVYKAYKPSNVNNLILQEEILGRDIKLDSNRGIVVDNSGDIAIMLPTDGLVANVADIITYPQGTLDLYPEWGIDIADIGSLNNETNKKIISSKMQSSIERDPRVQRVEIDMDKVAIKGSALIFKDIKVVALIGGELTLSG